MQFTRSVLSSQIETYIETIRGKRDIRGLSSWQVVALYLVMTAVVLYPVLSVEVPALSDYPNHLARMHILSSIEHSEPLSRFYQLHWQAIPYLAMDAAFIVLSHISTIYDAGRIFVALCVIAPVVSVMILHFVVHRRLSLIPLAAFLFCYNLLLSWGFLSYVLSLSLAVALFSSWIGSANWPRWPRAALFCVLALLLYLSHLMAFGAYCLAVGSFELARAWRAGIRAWPTIAVDWLAAGLQLVPTIVLAIVVDIERPVVGPLVTKYGSLEDKLIALESPLRFFGGRLEILAGVFALLALSLGVLTGRLRLAPSVWPAAAAVGAVAVCMPHWLLGIFGTDFRLPLLVVLLLIGATSATERLGRVAGCMIICGFLALTSIRAAGIATVLQGLDGQIAEIRQLIATMPRGMRLLVVNTAHGDHALPLRPTIHVAMVAVIDRDAFVPYLFTGHSTVRPSPALRTSSVPHGLALRIEDLADRWSEMDESLREQDNAMRQGRYWLGWESKFDYLLIQHFGTRPAEVPANLRLVATASIADLYQIDRTANP